MSTQVSPTEACHCEHYDKYAETTAYVKFLRETVQQTRDSAKQALVAANGYVAQVQQLKEVNTAMMIKMGRQENAHVNQMAAMQNHYKLEMAEMKERCQKALHMQDAAHARETMEMIMVMEQMKQRIRRYELTPGQKIAQDQRSSGSLFDQQSVACTLEGRTK